MRSWRSLSCQQHISRQLPSVGGLLGMPGMPEFTHRHDMIQKTTKDMQQWHSHQDHQGCEPTYFNTPSISWDHMSYVVRIIHIYYLFNVYYTVLYIWGFVSLCLCILQSLALRLSRLRFPPRAWPCDCTVFTSSLLLIFVLHVYEILRT